MYIPDGEVCHDIFHRLRALDSEEVVKIISSYRHSMAVHHDHDSVAGHALLSIVIAEKLTAAHKAEFEPLRQPNHDISFCIDKGF